MNGPKNVGECIKEVGKIGGREGKERRKVVSQARSMVILMHISEAWGQIGYILYMGASLISWRNQC